MRLNFSPKIQSTLWSRLLLAAAVALVFGVVASSGYYRSAEDFLQHGKFALSSKPASGQIHVVEMDAASVAAIQEWPWSRTHYAEVIQRLDAAGVKSIGFDVDFSSHSNLGGDQALADALANASVPVILPTFSQSASFRDRRQLDSLPIEMLREHVTIGSVSVAPDPDGFVRRMPLGTITDGVPRPSLSAFFAEEAGTAHTSFPVDYSIDAQSIPRHSFIAIERGEFDPSELRGKDIIIGATAIEMGDRYPVPRFGVIPGVIVQALGAETLFAGRPSYGSWHFPLALASGLGFLILFGKSYTATALRTALAIAVVAAGWVYAQNSAKVWFEIIPAILTLLTVGIIGALLIARDRLSQRQRTDAETGLPNAIAMRADLAGHEREYVIAGMIDGFDALKAVVGPQDIGLLLNRMVERLEVTGCEKPIYRSDDRVLSWTTSLQLFEIEEALAGLRAVMRSPFEIAGRRVDVALTFGVARANERSAISNAAHAASVAQRKGEKWRLHDADQSELIEQQVSLMGEMDAAMEAGHIKVYYQPKLDLKTNQVTCAEALVRWEHPTKGMLPPDSFIPMAEESGRIEDLTLHVIHQTIEDMREWCAQDLVLGAAVNISARLLSTPSFIARADALIANLGVPPSRLTFEVTESAELEDEAASVAALNRFRDRGISISMDDYGTGQSTLSYLKTLPISELKIDRCFVQHSHVDRGDAMLVRSTIQLAHELGLKVVCEGIEDAECLEFLRGIECDYAQGYFIAKPMTADALALSVGEPRRAAA